MLLVARMQNPERVRIDLVRRQSVRRRLLPHLRADRAATPALWGRATTLPALLTIARVKRGSRRVGGRVKAEGRPARVRNRRSLLALMALAKCQRSPTMIACPNRVTRIALARFYRSRRA